MVYYYELTTYQYMKWFTEPRNFYFCDIINLNNTFEVVFLHVVEYFLRKLLTSVLKLVKIVYFPYHHCQLISDVVSSVSSGTELIQTMNLDLYTSTLFIKLNKIKHYNY